MKILCILIKDSKIGSTRRSLSQNNEHYVSVVFKVLSTGCQWNSLNERLHYSVYNKHFILWRSAMKARQSLFTGK